MHVLYEDTLGVGENLESLFSKMADHVSKELAIKTDYEVDVSLLSLEEIREINREYRGKDMPTDVISFAFLDDKDPSHKINDFDGDMMLGEILICPDRAREQADDIGQSLTREMVFLFLHGLLHLLGYDHMKKEDEEIMFPLQDKLMEGFISAYGRI